MFVRRKKNRSGTTSVVVVDKSSGKFKELTTIGVSSSPEELDDLERKARLWIDRHTGQLPIDFDESEKARAEYRSMLSNVEHTMKVLGGRIGLVFYDVTTLYFESMPQAHSLRLTEIVVESSASKVRPTFTSSSFSLAYNGLTVLIKKHPRSS